MKTRDPARLRVAAARYLFARYPVAEHLEHIWIDSAGLAPEDIALRKRWYIVAAGGGSLYHAGADAWLSRKEVHAFLNPLARPNFAQAIWQAITRSYANDPGIAMRIASSRIAQWPRPEADFGFWREVVRFFCAHSTSVEEMEDLSDYLAHCRRQDARYGLKGRTLASLTRQMHAVALSAEDTGQHSPFLNRKGGARGIWITQHHLHAFELWQKLLADVSLLLRR